MTFTRLPTALREKKKNGEKKKIQSRRGEMAN